LHCGQRKSWAAAWEAEPQPMQWKQNVA